MKEGENDRSLLKQYVDDTPRVQQLREEKFLKQSLKQIAHDAQMALLVLCCILFYGSSVAVMVMFSAHKPCAISMRDAVFNGHQCCAKPIYSLGPARNGCAKT